MLIASKASDAACQFTAKDKSWLQIADADQTGLDPGTDDFLICGWVYFDTLSNFRTLVNKGAGGAAVGNPGFSLLAYGNGSPYLYYSDGIGVRLSVGGTVGTFTTGTWYFWALHCDRSGNAYVYVNNSSVPVLTLDIHEQAASINSSFSFIVGEFMDYSGYYHDGRQDSLMFFKAADLSAVSTDIIEWAWHAGAGRLCSEITSAQKTAWGAVSGWELGETSGRRFDSWGTNHLDEAFAELVTNGTFTGASTGWTEGVGWTYGINNEVATAADANLTQTTVIPTIGKLYSTSFALTATTGSLRFQLGGVNGTTRTTTATHTENIRVISAATLAFDPVATFTGVLDTVSIKAAEIRSGAGIHAPDNRIRLNFSNPILDKAAPGAIGGTTPSTGAFTTISATGVISVISDTVGLKLGAALDMSVYYDGTNGNIDTDLVAPSDLTVDCGTAKTLVLEVPVYQDANLAGAVLAGNPGVTPGKDAFVDEVGLATGIFTYSFAEDEGVHGSIEIPHDYKEGTNLVFHVHWQGIAAPSGTDNVQWRLIYTIARDGTTLDAAVPVDSVDTSFATRYEFKRTDIATIVGTNVKIGDQLLFSLLRVTATGDAYAGDVLLATAGIHYQVDTLGSRTISTK
jgi:hypothetical protein